MSLIRRLGFRKATLRSRQRPASDRACLRVENLEDRTVPSTAYLLIKTTSNPIGAILTIDTDNPSAANLSATVPISNTNGQQILGIDFRPDNGVLYGMSNASRLYAINPATGVASLLGAPGATVMDPFTGPASPFQGIGIDFNPVVDALRVVEDDGAANGQDDNFSINPNTGIFTQQTDLNDTGMTNDVDVSGLAYTNNFPSATQTTLYGIETNNPSGAPAPAGTDRLVIINPPASGSLTVVDSNANGLGIVVASQEMGFDIISDRDAGIVNRAFATIQVGVVFNLYRVDLAIADGGAGTGDATLVGSIGSAAFQTVITGFAVRGMALVLPGRTLAFGRGTGAPSEVRTFDAASRQLENGFAAFGGSKGVTVALGHFNNDGILDIVVGTGPGRPPRVKVFDGETRQVLASFLAYKPTFTGGIFVAAADVNNDQITDIITGAGSGPGAGRQVKVINGTQLGNLQANGVISGAALLGNFFAFGASFTGGTTVAAGDVNADGFADIIVGKSSNGSTVKVVNAAALFDAAVDTNAKGEILATELLASRNIFGALSGGVFVAAADMNFDGRAEVILGAGKGGAGGRVVVRSVQDNLTVNHASFLSWPNSNTAGARVAAVDADANGLFDIVVGTGANVALRARVFNGSGQLLFVFFTGFGGTSGVFVGGR